MSSADLHPEDLLDRVRRGQATAQERERVDAHLARCEACRFEQALIAQSMRDASPQPGDAARARAIEQAAIAALSARQAPARGRARRAGIWFAALAASSIATAAAAAVITQPAWLERILLSSSGAPKPAPGQPARVRRVEAPTPARDDVPPTPEPPPPDATPEPLERAKSSSPRHGTKVSAAELFATANAARRDHETSAAVRAYRELLRGHPQSPEAKVARVALGRLLLDRVGDARGALRELDAYLADREHGSLREDALIGRALALGRLGRSREERDAWSRLLEEFPRSASAERARARISALR